MGVIGSKFYFNKMTLNNVESRWARGRTGCKGISYRAIAVLFQMKMSRVLTQGRAVKMNNLLLGEAGRLKLLFRPPKRFILNLLFIYWGSRCKKKSVYAFFFRAWTTMWLFFLSLPIPQQIISFLNSLKVDAFQVLVDLERWQKNHWFPQAGSSLLLHRTPEWNARERHPLI